MNSHFPIYVIHFLVIVTLQLQSMAQETQDVPKPSVMTEWRATLFDFPEIPKTQDDAVSQEWFLSNEDRSCQNEKYWGIRMIENEKAMALLFDNQGTIAGFQTLMPKDIVSDTGYNIEGQPLYQTETIDDVEFLVITCYIINPAKICNQETSRDLEKGTVEDVFYQIGSAPENPEDWSSDSDSPNLRPVPLTWEEAGAIGWTQQACFDNMGWHAIWQADDITKSSCMDWQPTLALYSNEGFLQGCGMWMTGRQTPVQKRYESPPFSVIDTIMRDNAPSCLDTMDTTSLHVCWTDLRNFKCSTSAPGSHVEPRDTPLVVEEGEEESKEKEEEEKPAEVEETEPQVSEEDVETPEAEED